MHAHNAQSEIVDISQPDFSDRRCAIAAGKSHSPGVHGPTDISAFQPAARVFPTRFGQQAIRCTSCLASHWQWFVPQTN
jgi:hypothetical protein